MDRRTASALRKPAGASSPGVFGINGIKLRLPAAGAVGAAFHGLEEMMKNQKSIELLNKAVAGELQATHQYMYFHFHCDDQGYDLLANLFRRTAIDEMIHIERLSERILFLKGEVEMVPSGGVEKIHDVKAMLEKAAKMETETIADYNRWANECSKNEDSVSKKLFETLVAEEEEHYDRYDKETDNLNKFGDNYLALQSIERSKSAHGAGSGSSSSET
jgi:bacterioferritin